MQVDRDRPGMLQVDWDKPGVLQVDRDRRGWGNGIPPWMRGRVVVLPIGAVATRR